jgi:hypothetical protein
MSSSVKSYRSSGSLSMSSEPQRKRPFTDEDTSDNERERFMRECSASLKASRNTVLCFQKLLESVILLHCPVARTPANSSRPVERAKKTTKINTAEVDGYRSTRITITYGASNRTGQPDFRHFHFGGPLRTGVIKANLDKFFWFMEEREVLDEKEESSLPLIPKRSRLIPIHGNRGAPCFLCVNIGPTFFFWCTCVGFSWVCRVISHSR